MSIDRLHKETKMLSVDYHLSLLCSQYIARALQSNNSSHSVFRGILNKEETLKSRFLHRVAPYLSNDIIPTTEYKTTIEYLHTEAGYRFIDNLAENSVFETSFTEIAVEENLPRPYRTYLSQLRSSFCSSLQSCSERIGLASNSICSSCGRETNTTSVFFLFPPFL